MTTYLALFAKAFKKNLAYRAEVWVRVGGSLLAIVVQVAIWRAVLGHRTIAGVNLPDMITYAILNTAVAVVLLDGLFRDVDDRLRTGDIAVDLVRPLRYPLALLADRLGRSAFQLLFAVAPTVVLAWLLFGLRPRPRRWTGSPSWPRWRSRSPSPTPSAT